MLTRIALLLTHTVYYCSSGVSEQESIDKKSRGVWWTLTLISILKVILVNYYTIVEKLSHSMK
jgi:hypothetical protein